jgi:hypothetical protein
MDELQRRQPDALVRRIAERALGGRRHGRDRVLGVEHGDDIRDLLQDFLERRRIVDPPRRPGPPGTRLAPRIHRTVVLTATRRARVKTTTKGVAFERAKPAPAKPPTSRRNDGTTYRSRHRAKGGPSRGSIDTSC